MLNPPVVHLSPEVEEAIAAKAPVVAFESTIITHGLPHPINADTAVEVERIARSAGAVPATIAIIDGKLRAGLSQREIARLAAAKGPDKASRRDIAALMVHGATAGTTVAATMFIAARAGIRLFATGGIGGVHRGAETTFDISADLAELSRTPVAVVSAGVKSILDVAKTVELLESLGVPVIGYRTSELPGFFSRVSGSAIDHRFETVDEIAQTIAQHWAIGGGSGVLIANTIGEADALEAKPIEAALEQALGEARKRGVGQKEVTPFLLARIGELTAGASVKANVKLICHNARVAAEIAVAYQKIMSSRSETPPA
jgi:pseudouridine-5'-phosphate glycosidase